MTLMLTLSSHWRLSFWVFSDSLKDDSAQALHGKEGSGLQNWINSVFKEEDKLIDNAQIAKSPTTEIASSQSLQANRKTYISLP